MSKSFANGSEIPELTTLEGAVEAFKKAKAIANLTREEADKLPFTVVRVVCAAAGCKKHILLKDYGCSPYYEKNGTLYDITRFHFMCEMHFRQKQKGKNVATKPGAGINHLVK